MIKLKAISKSYIVNQQRVDALRDIDLVVPQGEIFGVIGKSGAGKSTLIRCVNLLEKPDQGSVLVDGVDLLALTKNELKLQRREMGMIFQHFNLLESRSLYHNVALPLELIGKSKAEIKSAVMPLLKLVDLVDRKDHYPCELSGGQKQRVAIARALATQPKVLLCDEATSALDPESTSAILQLLKKINKELGLTILLITHEMNVIKTICDKVGVLDEGQLVEQGSVIDIFCNPQSEVTKRLTQKALHLELPTKLVEKLQAQPGPGLQPIVRMTFVGDQVKEPVSAHLSKQFNVTTNILLADLETIHDSIMGFTVCELQGEQQALDQAQAYLEQLSIKVEVLGYV